MSRPSTRPGSILVVGTYPTSTVAATRILGRSGHRVVVGRSDPVRNHAFLSRYCAEVWRHPPLEAAGDDFIDALIGFLTERTDIYAVFPIGEAELVLLARHAGRLPAAVELVMPRAEIVEICQDKMELMAAAAKAGVSQTPFAEVKANEQLFTEAERIGYPCVVKPPNSRLKLFGRKALIVPDRSVLLGFFASWPAEHETLILQGFASGQRFDVYVVAREGRVLRSLQTKVLRTNRADGTGITVDAVTVAMSPRLNEESKRLISALDYTGVAYLQFHYDEGRDSVCLLEINPRLGQNFTITDRCGLDLPGLAVKLAHGEPLPELDQPFSYPLGKRYVWTFGDLTGLMHEFLGRELGVRRAGAWLLTSLVNAARADTHVTWSWRDPLPTLGMFAESLGGAVAKVRARRRPEPSRQSLTIE
jgi:predicted ATP-grasp superfamily ATP-dependent carboligase